MFVLALIALIVYLLAAQAEEGPFGYGTSNPVPRRMRKVAGCLSLLFFVLSFFK